MNDTTWSSVFPIVSTLFGVLASGLMGMAVARLGDIQAQLRTNNERLDAHIENKDLHYAAQAKLETQIKGLFETAKIAHERLDRVEART